MNDIIPRYQIGSILPLHISDMFHYQFYRIFPEYCSLVGCPINLANFSSQAVDVALERFWDAHGFLVGRQVDRISLGGVPVSAYAGRERILGLLDEAAKRSAVPTTTDFEEAIEGIRHFKLQRVAVAAKWSPELMGRVVDYLVHAGVEVVGAHADPHSANEVAALRPKEGVEVALALGRAAFAKMPDADGLLLAGGAWLSQQAVPILEAEFGRPVVTNPGATYWASLRQLQLRPKPGFGRLLDELLVN